MCNSCLYAYKHTGPVRERERAFVCFFSFHWVCQIMMMRKFFTALRGTSLTLPAYYFARSSQSTYSIIGHFLQSIKTLLAIVLPIINSISSETVGSL